MSEDMPDPASVEPLGQLIQQAMDVAGLDRPAVQRLTGLERQHLQQILTRTKPYGKTLPDPETQQALAKVPGVRIEDVWRALQRSAGIAVEVVDDISPARRTAHSLVDQLPEDELPRAVKLLIAMAG